MVSDTPLITSRTDFSRHPYLLQRSMRMVQVAVLKVKIRIDVLVLDSYFDTCLVGLALLAVPHVNVDYL